MVEMVEDVKVMVSAKSLTLRSSMNVNKKIRYLYITSQASFFFKVYE